MAEKHIDPAGERSSHGPHHDGPAGTRPTSGPHLPGAGAGRRWGWWGIAFVVAFVASIAAGSALTVGQGLYLPEASVMQLRAFYGANGATVLVQSALQLLAVIAIFRFGYRLRAALRPTSARASAAIGCGTAVAAGSMLASVLCVLALLAFATSASGAIVAGLGKAALVLGGAVHLLGSGLLITVASAVASRSHLRPRWVFLYGRAAGPLVAASALSVVVPPLVRPEPAFRLLAAVWLVGVSIGALRGRFSGPRGSHSSSRFERAVFGGEA